ncbi:YraN family protein [Halarcobacter sp.]|uniref:YraN family protein n=1 Tax=Halarcobacter sp. TaxID=2321133 RepID=UPI003A912697
MSTKEKGQAAEQKACDYLKSYDFEIVEQNFYAKKLGEIDIISKKNDTYHFVEVKSSIDYESAINNITPSKISKLKRSIDYYLQTKKLDVAYCIDVIIIVDDDIDLISNITI